LNELRCAETLAILASLPHVGLEILGARVVIRCKPVRILLELDGPAKRRAIKTTTIPLAKAARVVALSIDHEDINPEGAKWPK
jgi:hypothetical protein